jgi:hypothetical protein
MAHKKIKKKVSGTRRKKRRVGAVKGGLEHYALLALGALVGGGAGAYAVQAANTALSSATASAPWLPPALVTGAGLGVAVMSKGHAIGEGFGLGMAAVSGVMVANQTFLNVPGISGMAFSSNAGPANNIIRKSVGQAPGPFINKTVGAMTRRQRAMGALATN